MYQYPAGMQLAIYKQQEEDLLRKLRTYPAANEGRQARIALSKMIRWVNEKVLRAQPGNSLAPAAAARQGR